MLIKMSDSEFIYQFLLNSAKHYMEEEEGNNLNINRMNKNKKNFINYMEHEEIDGLEYFCDILTDEIVDNDSSQHFNRIKLLFRESSSQNTLTSTRQNSGSKIRA